MSSKSDIIDEDVMEVYDLAWRQIKEDRELVLSSLLDLKSLVSGSAERYAVCGDTLAKFNDILIKQSGQIVELLKIVHKNKEADDGLTEAELERIKKSIDE